MSIDHGQWNGKPAAVVRRYTAQGVPWVVIQTELGQTNRGKAYEQILHVKRAEWERANPSPKGTHHAPPR
jgi:hypothetical protein